MKEVAFPFGLSLKQGFGVLIVLYLITHLPMLNALPLMQDEAVYSIMIEEQIENPTLVVTFLGQEVGWKPPLFFWIYGFFVRFIHDLPVPIEAIYRLPGLLFGMINLFLVYFIFEKLAGRKEGFLAALTYAVIPLPILIDNMVLIDTLVSTFIFAGILCYIYGADKRGLYLLGGLFTLLAYFTKLGVAAMVPILAFVYLFEKDKKKIIDPLFIVTLLAVPLAMWAFEMSVEHIQPENFSVNQHIAQKAILGNLDMVNVWKSLFTFFPLTVIWLSASIMGLWKNWKRNLMVTVWYAMIVFPLIAGSMMPFYFYPVIPPLAYFSLQLFVRDARGKPKTDRFFLAVFSLVAVLNLIIAFGSLFAEDYYADQKNAGEFLAGKEDVMIIGDYAPGIFAYKMLNEKRENGSWLDYGLVISNSTDNTREFIIDYNSNHTLVLENFGPLFEHDRIFRKPSNITEFDYVCIYGDETAEPRGELVFDEKETMIYHMR